MAAAVLAGCASVPRRAPQTASDLAESSIPAIPDARMWLDADLKSWSAWQSARRASPAVTDETHMLAISSGSDKGAFSAGYLVGCSAAGRRPAFDLVTGVSAGALVAPFAFLGSPYDRDRAPNFTGTATSDVFRVRLLGLLFGKASFADSGPLRTLIARYVNAAFVEAIAVEHRKGRRLLILTTNLDAARGMVWDVGAIAASGSPARVDLVRSILLASASIPGLFAPVMIDSKSRERDLSEMHADGGIVQSILFPPLVPKFADADSGKTLLVLYNGKWPIEHQVVRRSVGAVVGRAFATLTAEADRNTLAAYRADHADTSIRFAAIDPNFSTKSKRLFERRYMTALFAYGRSKAIKEQCQSDDATARR